MFKNITLEKIDENKTKIHLNNYGMKHHNRKCRMKTDDIDYDDDILTRRRHKIWLLILYQRLLITIIIKESKEFFCVTIPDIKIKNLKIFKDIFSKNK